MHQLPYNPTRQALYHPASATDFFAHTPYQDTAALCAELSRFVYFGAPGRIDHQKLREFLGKGFELRAVADIGGSQAFLVENDTLVIMVFRGTQGIGDVLTDLNFVPRNWTIDGRPAGHVHRGFANALGQVLPSLRASLPMTGKPLVITGHSLGGAMATLAASVLRPSALYTFGQPRTGTAAFVQALKSQARKSFVYHRYVDCCDIVTRVPPPGFAGFRHAGMLHYIDRGGQISVMPEKSFISNDRAVARRDYWHEFSFQPGNVLLRDLADHAPVNYLSATLGRRNISGDSANDV